MNKQLKVAVIGDFMIDRYWIGEATRISPEAPIPVVKIKERFDRPGGAGNVAENLESLGVEVVWYDNYISFGNYAPVPIKNRLMVGDTQLARWDQDDECMPIEHEPKFLECDAVVVADYNKGSITPEIIDYIKNFEGPIFVDTKGDPSVWSGMATAIFPNEKELSQVKDAYQKFRGIVVVKRSDKGLELWTKPHTLEEACGVIEFNSFIKSPAQARFVRSVNGAGDTVIAAFVYAYLTNREPKNAVDRNCQAYIDFANTAAAIAVENPYTYAPTLGEVGDRYQADKALKTIWQ